MTSSRDGDFRVPEGRRRDRGHDRCPLEMKGVACVAGSMGVRHDDLMLVLPPKRRPARHPIGGCERGRSTPGACAIPAAVGARSVESREAPPQRTVTKRRAVETPTKHWGYRAVAFRSLAPEAGAPPRAGKARTRSTNP